MNDSDDTLKTLLAEEPEFAAAYRSAQIAHMEPPMTQDTKEFIHYWAEKIKEVGDSGTDGVGGIRICLDAMLVNWEHKHGR